jgi:hypothetical protein
MALLSFHLRPPSHKPTFRRDQSKRPNGTSASSKDKALKPDSPTNFSENRVSESDFQTLKSEVEWSEGQKLKEKGKEEERT